MHFACAMRHVDCHIEREGKDVVTPTDLVQAINYGEGMRGCIGELYNIDLKFEEYKKWDTAFKSGGGLSELGRVNIFKYGEMEDSHVDVEAYSYRYSIPVTWRFEMHKSSLKKGAENGTTMGGYVTIREGSTGHNGNGAVQERRTEETCNERREEVVCNEAELGGVTLLTRIEQLRPPIFCGSMTGARLISTAYMKRTSRVTKQKTWGCSSAYLSDGENDSDDEEEGRDSHGDRSEPEFYRQTGSSYRCSRCDEPFRSEIHAMKHASSCKTAATSTLFLDRAVICANTHIENRTISVHCKASENRIMQEMTLSDAVRKATTFPPFWAARPVSGIRLGSNFIDPFRADIEEMVKQGNMNKTNKLSNGQMQEQLRMLYPDRLDIPTTYHINSLVTSHRGVLRDQDNDGNACDDGVDGATRNTQYRMPIRYVQCLDSILNGNPNITEPGMKTAQIMAMGSTMSELPEDFPTEEQIINKATTLKRNILKQRGMISCYVIPQNYASMVEAILADDLKMKPREVMCVLRTKFSIEDDAVPEGWPSEKQLKVCMAAIKKDFQERKAEGRKKVRTESREAGASRYKMPSVYGEAIEKVLNKVPNVKVGLVEGLIIAHLGIEEGVKPADFPSAQQIMNRVAAVKRRRKKEQQKAQRGDKDNEAMRCETRPEIDGDNCRHEHERNIEEHGVVGDMDCDEIEKEPVLL